MKLIKRLFKRSTGDPSPALCKLAYAFASDGLRARAHAKANSALRDAAVAVASAVIDDADRASGTLLDLATVGGLAERVLSGDAPDPSGLSDAEFAAVQFFSFYFPAIKRVAAESLKGRQLCAAEVMAIVDASTGLPRYSRV